MASDYEKERQEALEAGEKALDSLSRAKECLQSAREFGVWDILGGRLLATMGKHRRMEQAHEHLAAAKTDLKRFEKELQDLDSFENINLETGDFLGFADYFFDGLFTDLAMQSRISDAQTGVDEAIRRVEEIMSRL
ncbi:MAG: hypothetical protein J5493_01870 [Lachnospiraceae bacterium]|nr:hypothetical protein [Lachnospiraceae bacterium]